MSDLSGDISRLIYRRTIAALKGNVSINGKMLELLMALDGETDLRGVAQISRTSISEIRPQLSKLLDYGLVEEAHGQVAMIGPQFFSYLAGQLSRITGPIAQMMVEDAVLEIGGGATNVPQNRADELIEILSRQIPDESQRSEFTRNMLKKLKEAQ